ncbi:MAG TPA: sugar ABC transporter ATP-binding protein [Baekduia sp.]|uniref:sugar ABC transporter ATP-binding protein n=1 Tax=Baekduia sp. TaxID=2600305 RepID=UPI002D79CDAE|nr:sugar ABC transporter ATP-binding protein [Baekduia sp.]HET6507315.1 sugar ABC transporter ATP-binding protein [Baekduia sp.]
MLEARGVRKTYGGVVALAGADLTVRAGAVHALLGENGAGKSTLVKAIAGAVTPDAGSLVLDGREVRFGSTAEAVRHGVAVVSQELNVFPDLDVLANLYPMREPTRGPFVRRQEMEARARPVLAELGLDVGLRQQVEELSLAECQLIEIAKALLTEPRVLILDEPTSALGQGSTENLLRILRVLRDRQVAVVFVSHILEDVMALCDEVTVLRDGAVVMSARPMSELTVGTIVDAMLGERGRQAHAPPAALTRDVAESVDRKSGPLALRGAAVAGRLEPLDLEVAPGEIVGLAGVAGAGHHVVMELVAGLTRPSAGTVTLPSGRPVPHGLRRAIRAGVALVSGDRRRLGLMLDKPIWENIAQIRAVGLAASGPLIRSGDMRAHAREHVERLRIRSRSVDMDVGGLSGGNQQKVVFAKWLDAAPSVFLLDDPTRGVDVGAKAEMHTLIRSTASAGVPVLLCSTDIDELATLCDRVIIIHNGRATTELAGDALTEHAVLEGMNTGTVAAS